MITTDHLNHQCNGNLSQPLRMTEIVLSKSNKACHVLKRHMGLTTSSQGNAERSRRILFSRTDLIPINHSSRRT
jgi:hypothetical protein